MSLTGWEGGAITVPVTCCWLSAEVVRGVGVVEFGEVEGAFVVHRAVLHMITRRIITIGIVLFRSITIPFRNVIL